MAYDGLTGIGIRKENFPSTDPYHGLAGITIQINDGDTVNDYRGLAGIAIVVDLNLPIRVTDSRGRGLGGVTVTIANTSTADPHTTVTDSQGNCLVHRDVTNPNPVTVTKNKIFKTSNYTGGNSFTIILDPVWDE